MMVLVGTMGLEPKSTLVCGQQNKSEETTILILFPRRNKNNAAGEKCQLLITRIYPQKKRCHF